RCLSDWSSDVCSSDLFGTLVRPGGKKLVAVLRRILLGTVCGDTRIGFDPQVLAKLFVNRSDLLLRCGDRLLAKKTRCILDASACRLRHADGHEHHSDGPYSSPASLRL